MTIEQLLQMSDKELSLVPKAELDAAMGRNPSDTTPVATRVRLRVSDLVNRTRDAWAVLLGRKDAI